MESEESEEDKDHCRTHDQPIRDDRVLGHHSAGGQQDVDDLAQQEHHLLYMREEIDGLV